MKNEMFYGHEKEFKSLEELQVAMIEYIHYIIIIMKELQQN